MLNIWGDIWDLYKGWPHNSSENIYFSTIAIFPLFSLLVSPHESISFFSAHSFQSRWSVKICIQKWNKDFLKVCLSLSFFLCLGVCSSLFRSARYVLPRSLSVGTVNYKRSFATSDHIILNSGTECRGSPNHVCACFLHFCQNDDVNRIAAICWRTLQVRRCKMKNLLSRVYWSFVLTYCRSWPGTHEAWSSADRFELQVSRV
jgi:hypothetical protein